MVSSGRPESGGDQPSLGDLVAQAARDVSALIRYEIALAKRELKVDGQRVATAGGLVVLGLMIVFPGVILLCFAYAYLLYWAGAPGGLGGAFAFAGLTFVVLALIAVVIARFFVKKVTGMRLTRKTVSDDLGMLRRGEDSPDGHGPAVPNPRSAGAAPGATAEIPARQLPGPGHVSRNSHQRAMDAPLGHRERDALPRGQQRGGATRPPAARVSRVLVDVARAAGVAGGGRIPGGRAGPARLRRQRQAAQGL
jgi:hypothetical protein